MTYRERLHIPWWWALIAFLFLVSIAVAVMAYLPLGTGLALTALAVLAVAVALIAYSATQLVVDGQGFSAGRNRIEAPYIGDVRPLEGQEARDALGVDADHRAFMFTRPYVASAVRVDIVDAADPHPYWLVSTRRPGELVDALAELKDSVS